MDAITEAQALIPGAGQRACAVGRDGCAAPLPGHSPGSRGKKARVRLDPCPLRHAAASRRALRAALAGLPYSFTAHAKDLFHDSVRMMCLP